MTKFVSLTAVSFCLVFSFITTGCLDRSHPLFKKWTENDGADGTKHTESRVEASPQLRMLEVSCRGLPYFSESRPLRKGISRENDMLFYYYRLDVDFRNVSKAVTGHLISSGWKVTKSESGIWEEQIEYEKDNYWIQLTHGRFGDSNYATNCQDRNITN